MSAPWLLYGANGYTGELIAREAVARGMHPILAGRSKQKIERLAAELNCPSAVFDLEAAFPSDRPLVGEGQAYDRLEHERSSDRDRQPPVGQRRAGREDQPGQGGHERQPPRIAGHHRVLGGRRPRRGEVAGERRAHLLPLAGLDPLAVHEELPLRDRRRHAAIEPRGLERP